MNSLYLPDWFYVTYIFLFGLCIGSFLNVAILRGLSGEDMVLTRSKCPICNNKLKWFMNIPLVSFVFLRGKCAFCKTKISWQYPIVEFLTGLFFVLSFLSFGFSLKTLFAWIVLSIFIMFFTTDMKETVIIDYHAYILTFIGVLASCFTVFDISLWQAIVGAIFGYIFFEILSHAGVWLLRHRTFGEGDSLIALGIGAVFGVKSLLIIIAISFLVQSLSAIPILIKKALKQGKVKLAISYLLTFVFVFVVALMNYFNLANNFVAYIFVLMISLCALVFSLGNIIQELKSKRQQEYTEEPNEQDFCIMPFGPALVIASAICLFYIQQVKEFAIELFM